MAGEQTDKVPSAQDIGAAVASSLAPQFEAILKAQQAPPAADKPPATDAELAKLVANGSITQAQADAHARERDAKVLKAQVKAEVAAEIKGEQTASATSQDIERYVTLEPGLADKNSEISKRCATAYQRMVKRGSPESSATQLAAVEAVLGPLDALEAARLPGRREMHEETGGGGRGGESEPAGAPAGLFKGVENRWREHYASMIGKGQYKGWDDPDLKAEIDIIRTAKKKH